MPGGGAPAGTGTGVATALDAGAFDETADATDDEPLATAVAPSDPEETAAAVSPLPTDDDVGAAADAACSVEPVALASENDTMGGLTGAALLSSGDCSCTAAMVDEGSMTACTTAGVERGDTGGSPLDSTDEDDAGCATG